MNHPKAGDSQSRAAILAIGTELTTGQVTNRNAPWISSRLEELGIETTNHITIPDDRALILEALKNSKAEFIFVTGGLGPTSDDFTREIIAQWKGLPLEFHEPSWVHINERLGRLKIPVAPSNKQQCYFPRGSIVITNSEGTANAFRIDNAWVLPGPPREIEAVWPAVLAQLRALVPAREREELLLWQLMGKSEAEVGEITEAALQGSGLRVGYRAHRPFVEVKVWVREGERQTQNARIEALNKALKPWTVGTGKLDFAQTFLKTLSKLAPETIVIQDALTAGILSERLMASLRAENLSLPLEIRSAYRTRPATDPGTLTLTLSPLTERYTWRIEGQMGQKTWGEDLELPYKSPELMDRSRRYAAEWTLHRWTQWLT